MVVAREGGVFTLPDGRRGAMLRAYDKKTGQELGAVHMPAPQTGSPMTYMHDGKQYIVVAISGPNFPGELIAFRLPAESGASFPPSPRLRRTAVAREASGGWLNAPERIAG